VEEVYAVLCGCLHISEEDRKNKRRTMSRLKRVGVQHMEV
jgi:hypothetical protein